MANDLPQGITESPIQSSAPLPAIEKPLGNGTTDVGTDLQQNQSSALAAGYPVHTQSGIIQPKTPPALPPGITESPISALPPAGGVPVHEWHDINPEGEGVWNQTKELAKRAKNIVANSGLGHAIESTLPKVSDTLGIHPTKTVYAKDYEKQKGQALSFEELAGNRDTNDPLQRYARGGLSGVSSMTTGQNLLIMGLTSGLGIIPSVGSTAVLSRLISGYFSADMILDSAKRYPEVYNAIKSGDYGTAAELLGQITTELIFATQAGKHAVTPEVQPGRIEADEGTQKILADRGDTRAAQVLAAEKQANAANAGRTYFRPTTKNIGRTEVPILAKSQENAPVVSRLAAAAATPGKANEFHEAETRPAATEAAVGSISDMVSGKVQAHQELRTGEKAAPAGPYATVDDSVAALESTAKPTYDKADAIDAQERSDWEKQKQAAVEAHRTAIQEHNKQVLDAQSEGEKIDTIPFNPANADLPEPPKFLSDLRAAETAAWDKARTGDAKERAEAYAKDIPKAEKEVDNWFKQHSDQIPEAEYTSAKDLTWRAKRLETVASKLRAPMLNESVKSSTLNGIEAAIDNQAIRRGQSPGAFRRLLGEESYQNWKSVVDVLRPPEKIDPNAKSGIADITIAFTAFGVGMLSHIWGGALGTIIPLKYASRFILDRALFNPEFGKWFTDAFSRFKNTGGKITPDMVDSLHGLIQKSPLTPAELKEAGFKDNEVANGDHTPIVGGVKLSQGPAPSGITERPVATPGHSYNYEENAGMHQVTVRDPEGKSVALIHAVEDPNDPNTWTTKFTAGGGGEGLKGYARLAEAAKSQAERTGKPVTIQGDVPDDMSGAARRTWQKLQEQHGYDVKWDNNDPSTGRPSVTFQPKGPETSTTPAPTAPETPKPFRGKSNEYTAAKVAKEIMFDRAGASASVPDWARDIADDKTIGPKDVRAAILVKLNTTPKLSQKAGVARARAKVTNSPEFKNWFGDSKVVEKEGTPKVVFHGTTHEFNQFEPERGSVEGQYGKGIYFTDSSDDMSHNYAGEGPDLTSRIEQRAEQIENEEFDLGIKPPKYGTPEYRKFYDDLRARAKAEVAGEHEGVAMPVYLKMENPIEMSQRGKGTYFDLDTDEDGNESGSALKLYQAVHDVAGEYGLDPQKVWSDAMEKVVDFDHFSAHQFDRALDATLGYAEVQDDTGAQALGDMKRKIYQAAGFDGIVTTASDDFPHMKNIPAGTKHYIAFEPEQVKSATGNTGAFDSNNPDIRLSQEDVSLEDWDKFREAPAPLEHPITHDMLKDAFHGQDVQQVDPRNYIVKLDNGSDLHVNLVDSITGPSVEMQLKPGNVALGSFQKIGDGGIMQLAGISGEATLGHETAHAGLGLLPKRLQDAVLEKFQGDEEKFADWYGDNRKTLDRGGEPDSLFGQIKNYFQDLYEKVFKPAQYAMRQIQEGRVWDRANEKFVESADLRPALSQKTYPAWEKSFRKAAAEQGATPAEIERHIKEVAPAYGLFKGLTDVPPDLKGSNLFDNAWEGKKTTFEYQGFCPKNKNFNPTKAAIEQQIGRFLSKQETIGLTLLMHSEALDAPCNYCYTLSGSAAVSENLGNTARNGVWVGGENIPETGLKLQTRPHPDKPGATQAFIPPVEERLLTDPDYREKMIAKDPELADKVKLQQWYGDKRVYGNLKAHKPTEEGIIPARGALLRKSPEEIAEVNSKRGYRVSGNVDVTPYSYMDVAQDMADARLMGAKRYSYTKQPDYVRLVGNTGEKVNMSLTMDPRSTDFIRNDWSDSMNFDDAKALRKQFPNAGTMLMTLNDNHILAGLKNPDVDMMIPYHGTRGKFPAAVKEFVQDYSRENHETDMKTGDTISGDKEIKQTEHNGDLQTYLRICKERGYLPKFARFIYDNVTFNKSENGVSSVRIKTDPETGEPEPPKIRKDTSKNYMKLVKDIARTDSPHVPIQRNVDMDHLNSVVSQIKAGNMPWSGQAHPGVTKMAVDRIKAGKPLYNGEMGYSYTPKAEVPLVQIQPAPKPASKTTLPKYQAGVDYVISGAGSSKK